MKKFVVNLIEELSSMHYSSPETNDFRQNKLILSSNKIIELGSVVGYCLGWGSSQTPESCKFWGSFDQH